MIFRAFTLVVGLTGAFGAAQFPAYSQQYMQRLGGAVDALQQVVADFDASATAEGLSRTEALEQMRGTPFVERRRTDMIRTFERHDQLRADLAVLHGKGPFMRAYRAGHLTDAEISARAWQAFQPALPLTLTTLLFAAIGFTVALFALGLLRALLRWPLRRRSMPA